MIENPGDLAQDPKSEKSAGRGAGTGAGKTGGAGRSAVTGAGRLAPLGNQRENSLPAPVPALRPETPIFASTCAGTSASTFLEFSCWGPVPGRRDLNSTIGSSQKGSVKN